MKVFLTASVLLFVTIATPIANAQYSRSSGSPTTTSKRDICEALRLKGASAEILKIFGCAP